MTISRVAGDGAIEAFPNVPAGTRSRTGSHPLETIANANTKRIVQLLQQYRNVAPDCSTNPSEGSLPSDKEEKSCQSSVRKPGP